MSPGIAASERRLVVVGESGWTALGSSFVRAAAELGIQCELCDVREAQSAWRLVNSVAWNLGPKLPPFPGRVRRSLRDAIAATGPVVVLTTGRAPVRAGDLEHARDNGALLLHFSSDDPWNANFAAPWHFRALLEYDVVFTPRCSNLAQFEQHGCRAVRYMPFGFDPTVFPDLDSDREPGENGRALFVGGADADRAEFVRKFKGAGGVVALVGGYWNRYADLAGDWIGHLAPEQVADQTRKAGVNLILVRRANRDGHTMRSFEAAAIGGCLMVEDTDEHRAIFGPDGEAVRYFDGPRSAAVLQAALMQDADERSRLARAAKDLIRNGRNTYADRLEAMLAAVDEQTRPGLMRGVRDA